jgi:uncharacterized membrane protein
MRKWLPIVLVAAAVVFSLAAYSRLPESMPVHWGLSGEPDRYGSRLEGAFVVPAIMVALLVFLLWLPSRDPRVANIAKFRDTYDVMVAAVFGFMGVVHVVVLGSALGWPIDITTVVIAGVGILFMILGNLMPRARSNFIFGIRTPWTLSSDTVWTRSHRVGGYTMVAAGLLTAVSAFIDSPWRFVIVFASLTVAAIVPIVYSYILWSRERGGPASES